MSDDQSEDLRALIAKNVALLVTATYGQDAGKGINQLIQFGELSRGMAGRIVTPDGTGWSVSALAGIAKALKVQPWQILLPDLHASRQGNVTSIEGMRARQWPFPTLSRAELDDLSPLELERLEKTIRTRVAELKEDRPPAPRTNAGGKR